MTEAQFNDNFHNKADLRRNYTMIKLESACHNSRTQPYWFDQPITQLGFQHTPKPMLHSSAHPKLQAWGSAHGDFKPQEAISMISRNSINPS